MNDLAKWDVLVAKVAFVIAGLVLLSWILYSLAQTLQLHRLFQEGSMTKRFFLVPLLGFAVSFVLLAEFSRGRDRVTDSFELALLAAALLFAILFLTELLNRRK